MGLIAPEVDMGTTALIGATLLPPDVRGRHAVALPAADVPSSGSPGSPSSLYNMPERLGRVLAFIYPDKYPADAYQAQQGLIALGSGGVEGLGLGQSAGRKWPTCPSRTPISFSR